MISVCMATYNGEKFIEKQLTSILTQLGPNDEVIIIDDNSKDETVFVIKNLLKDYPIAATVMVNDKNKGPIGSFETAIEHSKGEFIVLADQDDEWLPNKISKIMETFEKYTPALIVHDARVIDGSGKELAKSWNQYNSNKISKTIMSNVFKNGYTGCMMAFTRELAQQALPFPSTIEMHDQWIALVAIKTKSEIRFIEEPLMNYVRHGNNVTGMKKRKITEMMAGRVNMLNAILRYK